MAEYDAKEWNLGLQLDYKNILFTRVFINDFQHVGVQLFVKFEL
jgi:hypothetical protein